MSLPHTYDLVLFILRLAIQNDQVMNKLQYDADVLLKLRLKVCLHIADCPLY